MKYWKSLSAMIAHIAKVLPEWEDMFLSYKDLKKQLKLIFPKEGESSRPTKRPRLEDGDHKEEGGDQPEVAKEVTDFETLLRKEINKLNSFFIDKEEEYVINLKVSAFRFNYSFIYLGIELIVFLDFSFNFCIVSAFFFNKFIKEYYIMWLILVCFTQSTWIIEACI